VHPVQPQHSRANVDLALLLAKWRILAIAQNWPVAKIEKLAMAITMQFLGRRPQIPVAGMLQTKLGSQIAPQPEPQTPTTPA
jgi:hypothetical protein